MTTKYRLINTRDCVCVCVCVCVCAWFPCTCARARVCVCVCACVRACVHVWSIKPATTVPINVPQLVLLDRLPHSSIDPTIQSGKTLSVLQCVKQD